MSDRDPGRVRPVVVVGAASRDVTDEDPRGWRLGGGVTYSSLALARLGVPTRALVGVDPPAARAAELDLLRQAGADVRLVELGHGPVFVNRETPSGRIQECVDPGAPLPADALPADWADSAAWLLAPVADELPAAWAAIPAADDPVALGWQGLLRTLEPGRRVIRRPPGPSPLVRRASLVGVSHQDLAHETRLDDLWPFLAPAATLILTQGVDGGLVVDLRDGLPVRWRRYPAVGADRTDDPTGAGDVFLAAFFAARLDRIAAPARLKGAELRLAAAAASLVVERPGLIGVPDPAAVAARLARSARLSAARPRPAAARPGSPADRSTPGPAG